MTEPPVRPGESSFWHELQRRKVLRVATAYLLACFVLLQVLDAAGKSLGVTAGSVASMGVEPGALIHKG